MRGIDPVLTAITGHASAYAALLCLIGTRLASSGGKYCRALGRKPNRNWAHRFTPGGFYACAPFSAAAMLI